LGEKVVYEIVLDEEALRKLEKILKLLETPRGGRARKLARGYPSSKEESLIIPTEISLRLPSSANPLSIKDFGRNVSLGVADYHQLHYTMNPCFTHPSTTET